VTCIPEFCPTGELAPIPLGECCPKSDQCNNTNCAEVRCLVERCPDGSIAPRPPGMCCPSLTQCSEKLFQPDVTSATIEEGYLDDVTKEYDSVIDTVTEEEFFNLDMNCAAVSCVIDYCDDGSVPPTPPGSCCPDMELCSARFEPDCSNVACFIERCADGSRAPVPLGKCCPDKSECLVFSNDIGDWAL